MSSRLYLSPQDHSPLHLQVHQSPKGPPRRPSFVLSAVSATGTPPLLATATSVPRQQTLTQFSTRAEQAGHSRGSLAEPVVSQSGDQPRGPHCRKGCLAALQGRPQSEKLSQQRAWEQRQERAATREGGRGGGTTVTRAAAIEGREQFSAVFPSTGVARSPCMPSRGGAGSSTRPVLGTSCRHPDAHNKQAPGAGAGLADHPT